MALVLTREPEERIVLATPGDGPLRERVIGVVAVHQILGAGSRGKVKLLFDGSVEVWREELLDEGFVDEWLG